MSAVWILLFVSILFAATIDLWADPINWVLRRLGSQGAGRPARPDPLRHVARVETSFRSVGGEDSRGKVFYEGSLWNARCPGDLRSVLRPGDRVEISRGQELELEVVRKVERLR